MNQTMPKLPLDTDLSAGGDTLNRAWSAALPALLRVMNVEQTKFKAALFDVLSDEPTARAVAVARVHYHLDELLTPLAAIRQRTESRNSALEAEAAIKQLRLAITAAARQAPAKQAEKAAAATTVTASEPTNLVVLASRRKATEPAAKPRKRGPGLSGAKLEKALQMVARGRLTKREIAERVGCSLSTLYRHLSEGAP